MNNWNGIGRTTSDPEVRYSGEMAIAKFTLAVDRKYKKDGEQTADFIRCVAFGKNGEFAEKYLRKGMKVGITGRIQTGSYDDKDGKKVYTTEIVVEEYTFCESKNANEGSAAPQTNADGWMNIPDNIGEELPFN